MRYFLAVAGGAMLLTGVTSDVFAQRHEIPQLNSCIKEFYDPEMYKWLTFRNTCSESLTLVFLPKDGSGPGGTMQLRAGAKDSVGKPQGNGKVQKLGSFAIFVCPANNIPVDENNQPVSKPDSSFHCIQKPE